MAKTERRVSMRPEDFDSETLQLMYGYAGRELFSRRSITEEVFSDDGNTSWDFQDFLDDMAEALAKVPSPLRAKVTVELTRCDCDYGVGGLTVSYKRPETDEELAQRVDSALGYARQKQREERAIFDRLKEKFTKPKDEEQDG